LRIAIDISIWQFQIQAARGGSNPAIRTLFYRLLRLLSLSIEPIFVFDGPNKPVFKRNKRSGRGDGVATSMAKRLIRLFGFQSHDAPGEAEAECALLQKNGIVDAVFSEDVDTIMFGCTQTMRNWSAEGTKGSKTPTHVSMYDTAELRQGESGLDREGMVLVALMSGGDYLPEGIPGAGVKLACEAARAGFGKSVCRLKKSDTSGLAEWRENLIHELRTNENGFFRTKHKALTVPEDFPNLEVLRYYTHPVVSPTSTLDRLRNQIWDKPIDVVGLREFVRETFDWNYRGGAIKFIRVLAPGLLVRKMMTLSASPNPQAYEVERIEKEEAKLVKSITNRREHFSTDATPELRISFTPTEIVGYGFEEEPEEDISFGRDGLALNSDDEFEAIGEEDAETIAKPGSRKPFSPNELDLFWIPETVAKLGIPLMVQDWEEARRAKASKPKTKVSRQKVKVGGMAAGALDRFVKVTKNVQSSSDTGNKPLLDKPRSSAQIALQIPPQSQLLLPISTEASIKPPRPLRSSKQSTKPKKASGKAQGPPPDPNTNPWTIAGLQSSPRATKTKSISASSKHTEAIFISSSPAASPSQAARSPVTGEGLRCSLTESHGNNVMSTPHRRSKTPQERGDYENSSPRSMTRAASQTPITAERLTRKLARTESMPISSPRADMAQNTLGTPRTGFTRAHTVAAEPEPECSDDDMDLPPLSSFGRIPKRHPAASPIMSRPIESITIDSSPVSQSRPLQLPRASVASLSTKVQTAPIAPAAKKQTKLNDAFGMRMTKFYVPRKSEPGFFKEIDISVDEAERQGRDKGRQWRRSDVSVVDLTEDG
jgi:Holliday junction resolvase YEN1